MYADKVAVIKTLPLFAAYEPDQASTALTPVLITVAALALVKIVCLVRTLTRFKVTDPVNSVDPVIIKVWFNLLRKEEVKANDDVIACEDERANDELRALDELKALKANDDVIAREEERANDELKANDEDAIDPENEPVIEEAKIPPLTTKPFSIIYSLGILQ
jgi:hypothetical protein